MKTRREFLIMATGTVITVSMPKLAFAAASQQNQPIKATAITKVFGDGAKCIAIAVEFSHALTPKQLHQINFKVENRTITDLFISQSPNIVKSHQGHFVIIALSPNDTNNSIIQETAKPSKDNSQNRKEQNKPQITNGKPNWKAGDKMYAVGYHDANVTLTVNQNTLKTTSDINLIVDTFQQNKFNDPTTGKTLPYNLFIPQQTDTPLPLVLFMHDAGASSQQIKTTLFQGLGAVVWADPIEQKKRPCYVLAPQFDEIIADDNWQTSDMLDTTIHLIENLLRTYRIDPNRIYSTGQSGGCMLNIAMNIKYPKFFAASYLVAGKWGADLIAPMAKNTMWFMASEDDLGAFPSFNQITERLEQLGTHVSHAEWDARWTPEQYQLAYDEIISKNNAVNYTFFIKDSVFRDGDNREGASGHRNTWRWAYSIEPIRAWLFAQTK